MTSSARRPSGPISSYGWKTPGTPPYDGRTKVPTGTGRQARVVPPEPGHHEDVPEPLTLDEAASRYATETGLRAGIAAGTVTGRRHAVPKHSELALCGQDCLPMPGTLFPVEEHLDGVCWDCVEAVWALAVDAGYADLRPDAR